MKRLIVVFLTIQLILLAGCTFPFFGGSKDEPSSIAEGQDMVKIDESGQTGSNAGASTNTAATGIGTDKVAGTGTDNADGTRADKATGTGTDNAAGTTATSSGSAISANTGNAGISDLQPAASGLSADASSLTTDNASSLSETQGVPLNGTTPDSTGVMGAESGSDSSALYSEPRRPVTVYYQDGDGYLIPMTRWIEPQQGIARAAVSLITDSALNREEIAYYGVYPVLPADTEVLGIDIRNGTAVIDFSRKLLNYGSAKAERNIIASIVYTLTEFETINSVRILINGYEQGVMKYGTDLASALGREEVAINADPSVLANDKDKADVFLLKQANTWYTYPVPVTVTSTGGSANRPEELVKLLLDTVSKDGLTSEMPDGAALLGTSLKDGVITLDFSGEFTDYGGTAREEGILKQLAYTLRQCKDIKKIRILVEGRETQLPEGTDISGGLSVPITVNDVMDR
ncbi:MAG TPA: GerMN domain-containing protein [Clostridia bacterium]|nr:GerMN domain-containing protein [Clostridia bacterium]